MSFLLVFDLDGTLIDSAHDICLAVNRTLHRYGKPSLNHQIIRDHIGDGLRKLILDFFPEYPSQSAEAAALELEFFKDYEDLMLQNTKVFDGVHDFLSHYKGPLGIITNKSETPARTLIKHLNLDQYPWVGIYGWDTWPEKKPSPLPLQKMMEKAQKSKLQTIMIGDGTPDMISAQRASVKSIAVEFGYTKLEILLQHKPAASFNHYNELRRVIDRLSVDPI